MSSASNATSSPMPLPGLPAASRSAQLTGPGRPLIEASDAGLVLSTFDYETSARATLTADVNDEGKRWSAAGSSPTSAAACRPSPSR